ncbi:hypothetical protein RFI_13687 [Reticulomyxa filosa]|uniref:Uncharacterized protein n=1 Tax=Reticulomyxa filosa TaxID=46433 RepID=X6NDS0_RETFI|nr:hypothetical protein RFI_13687 [Reticulomyxa filosa]|eukprot:ETO23487.1 hypothetical protein RFI_13687 [Reticulomyxa filosa]
MLITTNNRFNSEKIFDKLFWKILETILEVIARLPKIDADATTMNSLYAVARKKRKLSETVEDEVELNCSDMQARVNTRYEDQNNINNNRYRESNDENEDNQEEEIKEEVNLKNALKIDNNITVQIYQICKENWKQLLNILTRILKKNGDSSLQKKTDIQKKKGAFLIFDLYIFIKKK